MAASGSVCQPFQASAGGWRLVFPFLSVSHVHFWEIGFWEHACLSASYPLFSWLAAAFSYISTHAVRDPVPIAHTPPVPPTSVPSNSLTASSAHLPCLRPLFPSFIFALLTIKKYIKKFFYSGVLISAIPQCKSAIIIHTPPSPLEPPISPGHHGANLGPLWHIATTHQQSPLHLRVYIGWCYFLHLFHSLPLPPCPQVHSLHLLSLFLS